MNYQQRLPLFPPYNFFQSSVIVPFISDMLRLTFVLDLLYREVQVKFPKAMQGCKTSNKHIFPPVY